MKIVFALTTAVIGTATIYAGSHWPANDPLVLEHPGMFSEDPRVGLQYTRRPDELDEEPVRTKRPYVRHQ